MLEHPGWVGRDSLNGHVATRRTADGPTAMADGGHSSGGVTEYEDRFGR